MERTLLLCVALLLLLLLFCSVLVVMMRVHVCCFGLCLTLMYAIRSTFIWHFCYHSYHNQHNSRKFKIRIHFDWLTASIVCALWTEQNPERINAFSVTVIMAVTAILYIGGCCYSACAVFCDGGFSVWQISCCQLFPTKHSPSGNKKTIFQTEKRISLELSVTQFEFFVARNFK